MTKSSKIAKKATQKTLWSNKRYSLNFGANNNKKDFLKNLVSKKMKKALSVLGDKNAFNSLFS